MSPGRSNRLALALYRAVLKWSRDNADVPFSLRPQDVATVAPHLRATISTGGMSLQDAVAIPPIARAEFEACRHMEGDDAAEALDRGLEAVRALHTSYQQQLQGMRDTRRDRGDKTGVKYSIGQVFVHKKYGFRCVVYGWDRTCERDEEWLRAMNVQNPRQAFYFCLPDETDCVRLFGGVRITKYVAEDNLQPVEHTRIVHRALDAYFSGYSPTTSRYIPCRKLQFEYPDDYTAEDGAPLGDDSNLLAHDEPEVGDEARLHPSRDDGRTFANVQA